MKKRRFWIICMVPTINAIVMSVFQYIENTYSSGETYNWWIDFLLLMIMLIFEALHYILAFSTPIFLYKLKKGFNLRSCVFSVMSILVANIIRFLQPGERYHQLNLNEVPQYMSQPIYITMATVIIVSMLILAKQSHDGKK